MNLLSTYFQRSEFSCRCGCGYNTVDSDLLQVLEDLREELQVPVYINSGCRCSVHNRNEGGALRTEVSPGSQHLYGKAADIVARGVTPDTVYGYLADTWGHRVSLGRYDTFTHVDVRTTGPVTWDDRTQENTVETK